MWPACRATSLFLIKACLARARGIQDSCICICIGIQSNAKTNTKDKYTRLRGSTTRNEYIAHSLHPISRHLNGELFTLLHSKKEFVFRARRLCETVHGSMVALSCMVKNASISNEVGVWRVLGDLSGKGAGKGDRLEIALVHMREQTCIIIIYYIVNHLIVCLIAHMMRVIGIF